MELYLQFGYGMMGHCRELIGKWKKGTVILSPRDLSPEQMASFPKDILRLKGRIMLDPQLYDPRADHHGLIKHEYWPDNFSTGILMGGSALSKMLQSLKDLNDIAQTDKYIIPGIYCGRVTDD